ncbi:MAG: hypothetical protein JWM68_3630 [Verrucomicrobiales bacterium]|nr:hypothetical protein [Verrucomicrobiales bacterium]
MSNLPPQPDYSPSVGIKKILCTLCVLAALLTTNRLGADCVPVPSGIIRWWTADGHAKELINSQSSTFFGGFSTGKVGKAFNFFGEPFVMNGPGDISVTNGLTVELWMRPSYLAAGQTTSIITRGSDTNTSFALLLQEQSGIIQLHATLATSTGTNATLTAGSVTTNSWSHIALTYDAASSAVRLFLNGSVIASNQCLLPSVISGGSLSFGGDNSRPDYSFTGMLDEVSLYDRALSAAELGAIVTSDADGKCKRADLLLTSVVSENPVLAGTNLTWTVVLTNRGIGSATNVALTLTIPFTGCDLVSFADFGTGNSSSMCYSMIGSLRCGTGKRGTTVTLPGSNELLSFSRSITATVVLNFFGIGSYQLESSATPHGNNSLVGITNVLNLEITGSPQLRMIRSNALLEIYWADKYYLNAFGFFDRFQLEESASDGPVSWQPVTTHVTAGNYRARIVTNLTVAPSHLYRLRENTNQPPD